MTPFKIPAEIGRVQVIHPTPKTVLSVSKNDGPIAIDMLAQLWLSEGIPHAFGQCPAVYSAIRSWLAKRLNIHPKEISMVGSGRLGKSLAPRKFGRKFGAQSDLDLFVVSEALFEALTLEFFQWKSDYDSNIRLPRSSREKRFWDDNKTRVPKTIHRGFIDVKFIPVFYEWSQRIINSMWQLKKKLDITPAAPKIKNASIRVYRDWNSSIRQISLNLSQSIDN